MSVQTLTQLKAEVLGNIAQVVDEQLKDFWPKYVKNKYWLQSGEGVPTEKSYVSKWEPDLGGIGMRWEEYWSGGRRDSGYEYVPYKLLYDSVAFDTFCKDHREKNEKNKRELEKVTQTIIKNKELAMLAELKEKYE